MTPERQAAIDELLAAYAAQLKMTQMGPNDYAITARDVESDRRGGLPLSEAAGVIFTGVLTKAIVKALPDDVFLLSNVSNGDGSPVVVRKVGEQARRGELWEKIRSARLNGRRFYVFADQGWAELVA